MTPSTTCRITPNRRWSSLVTWGGASFAWTPNLLCHRPRHRDRRRGGTPYPGRCPATLSSHPLAEDYRYAQCAGAQLRRSRSAYCLRYGHCFSARTACLASYGYRWRRRTGIDQSASVCGSSGIRAGLLEATTFASVLLNPIPCIHPLLPKMSPTRRLRASGALLHSRPGHGPPTGRVPSVREGYLYD